MHRDRGSDPYDNIFASDTGGFADPRNPRTQGDEPRQRDRDEQAHSPASHAFARSRPGAQPPRGSANRAAWDDAPLPRATHERHARHDERWYGPDEGNDETSGYAQGYAGYGQGHGDRGPGPREQEREPMMGYGPQGPYPRQPSRMSQGPHRGRGPQGYHRSDERIREDVCEALTYDPWLDASRLQVMVQDGVVTLEGTVGQRYMKYLAEDCAAHASGVKDVENHIRLDALMALDRPGLGSPSPRERYPDDPTDR